MANKCHDEVNETALRKILRALTVRGRIPIRKGDAFYADLSRLAAAMDGSGNDRLVDAVQLLQVRDIALRAEVVRAGGGGPMS